MVDCLETLVGLSDRNCPCFNVGERPANYNTSESGYYITDYEDGFPLIEAAFAATDCGDDSSWMMLTRARQQAIRDFETFLLAEIYTDKNGRFASFKGPIGQRESSSTVSANLNFSGIELDVKKMVGGYAILSEICLGLDCSGSKDIEIYSSDDTDTPIHTESITAVAGQFVCQALTTPLELPLWSNTCDDLKYYIVYDPTGCSPLNNKFTCCNKKIPFSAFTKASGVQADDLELIRSRSSYGMGLSLEVHLQCKELDWLCNLDDLAEYSAKDVIAKTIQYKGAAKVISAVLESGNINFYTMLSRESLYGKRNALNKNFKTNIEWIAQNIPQSVSDCLKCKHSKIRKRPVLV